MLAFALCSGSKPRIVRRDEKHSGTQLMRPEGRQSKIGSRETTTNGDSRIVRESMLNGHPLSVRIVLKGSTGSLTRQVGRIDQVLWKVGFGYEPR